jgi:hypothetical protein
MQAKSITGGQVGHRQSTLPSGRFRRLIFCFSFLPCLLFLLILSASDIEQLAKSVAMHILSLHGVQYSHLRQLKGWLGLAVSFLLRRSQNLVY